MNSPSVENKSKNATENRGVFGDIIEMMYKKINS